MSLDVINNNPKMLREWIEQAKVREKKYREEHPDSLIPLFEAELRELGYDFEISNQTLTFMPKHKKTILPIAIRYYQEAKKLGKDNEQEHFLSFFHFKGFDDVVPMLLEDFHSTKTKDLTRWFIGSCLYEIRSKSYIPEYLEIISNAAYGSNRQLLILLMGEWKVEDAIPILIELLEDEDVRLHAISALGYFKREEFRPYFERFENSKHSGWRKYARAALKKLDKQQNSSVSGNGELRL
ncbi:MAG: HEAT repeat domain-containing protein [Acetatifactor sp.]|nr:HEAT repeat domain-containing protein [Acetatifactor sp.]